MAFCVCLLSFKGFQGSPSIQAYLVLLCFTDTAVILQNEDLWQPCIEQIYWRHFPITLFTLCLCVSLGILAILHANVFIINIFVTVIYDWCLQPSESSAMVNNFFAIKFSFIKAGTLVF